MSEKSKYDAIALLSGGLDSILAARLIQEQGKRVLCLHFVTPFFGKPHLVGKWKEVYGLEVLLVDVSAEFVTLLRTRPEHGFGKVLNPCIDCKILLLRKAREMMSGFGAKVILTGEVLGQRPMSQRRDALNIIRREAGVRDLVLRPLCAQLLEETPAEACGFLDRSKLLSFSGRGRKGQLSLAARYGITDIPTPAGGCRLTEQETARNYWPVLRFHPAPAPADFIVARAGRQYWSLGEAPLWLAVGRNQSDNEQLASLAGMGDLLFTLVGHAGATGLCRTFPGCPWNKENLQSAAAVVASFSSKAVSHWKAAGVTAATG